MHANDKPNTTANPNAEGDDLGQVGDKATTKQKKPRWKHPNRIKTVCSFLRKSGEPFASLCIETYAGAVFRLDAMHRNMQIPKAGQEIEDWLLFVEPMNIDAQLLIAATWGK